MTMRLFPELFARHRIAPGRALSGSAAGEFALVPPHGVEDPAGRAARHRPVQLGVFRARLSGAADGRRGGRGADLFVKDDLVFMRTIRGPQRVDVVIVASMTTSSYPLAFRPDELGVPGLLSVYRAGRVTLANAVGSGIADEKADHSYVPDMIDFYLAKADPQQRADWTVAAVLRIPPTRRALPSGRQEVHGAGGYGHAGRSGRNARRNRALRRPLRASPRAMSRSRRSRCRPAPPTSTAVWRRAISTRARSCCRAGVTMVPGGLCRVALGAGSLS